MSWHQEHGSWELLSSPQIAQTQADLSCQQAVGQNKHKASEEPVRVLPICFMLGYLNSISKWVCLVFHSWICSVLSTNLPQSPFLMCFPNQLLPKKGRPLPGWSSPGSAGDVLQPHGEIPRWTGPTGVFPKNKVGSGLPTLPAAQRGDLQPGGGCTPAWRQQTWCSQALQPP